MDDVEDTLPLNGPRLDSSSGRDQSRAPRTRRPRGSKLEAVIFLISRMLKVAHTLNSRLKP